MNEDTCPGCDGTIARAIQQGREITTYERCGPCAEREEATMDRFRAATITCSCLPGWRTQGSCPVHGARTG